MLGESAVREEFFETLFERLSRVGVLYFTEENCDEVIVGCGVVDFDDDVWAAAVENGVVGVSSQSFECGTVVGKGVRVPRELGVGRLIRGVKWFVEAEVAGAVVVDFDTGVV